jgi:hypothetical protein
MAIFPVPIKKPVRSLGDLPADPLYWKQNPPQGSAGQGAMGPLNAPIMGPTESRTFDDLCNLLAQFPNVFDLYWKKKFLQIPREVYPFCVPANNVTATPNAYTDIVTYTVPDKMCGFITNFGIEVAANAYANIAWSLRINNTIHPALSAQSFGANNLANPFPFPLEVIQSSKLALGAFNSSGAGVNCSAILIGWLERVDSTKDFGGAPSSGI